MTKQNSTIDSMHFDLHCGMRLIAKDFNKIKIKIEENM